MKLFWTKDQVWLDRWDEFVFNSIKGSHLVYSDWLKSYKSYGFDFEICLILDDNDTILAGYGAVIPKALIFKFYIIPIGPIVDDYSDVVLKTLFNNLENRARTLKCIAAQISIPYSKHPKVKTYTYQPGLFDAYLLNFEQGKCFDYIYAAYGLNWIDLTDYKNFDEFINNLHPQTRRNFKISNKYLNLKIDGLENKLRVGYHLIEQNARNGGYKVRSWRDIKTTFTSLQHKEYLLFDIAYENSVSKGSSLLFKTKHYLSYSMGGTLKEKPDRKVGYYLHCQAIKRSFDLKNTGYNISMGGTKGVQEFKSKFGAEAIYFENPHFNLIINSFRFNTFKVFDSKIKPLKSIISKILHFFK